MIRTQSENVLNVFSLKMFYFLYNFTQVLFDRHQILLHRIEPINQLPFPLKLPEDLWFSDDLRKNRN